MPMTDRTPTGASMRDRVLMAMSSTPEAGRVIAERAGVTHKQVVDALYALHLSERIVRHGSKATARWRLPTPAEAADAERRRKRGRGEGW